MKKIVFLIFLAPMLFASDDYIFPGGSTWDPACQCWVTVEPPDPGGWNPGGNGNNNEYEEAAMVSIAPIPFIFGDYSAFSRVYALGPMGKERPEIGGAGYRVIERKDWSLNAGLTLAIRIPFSAASAGFGTSIGKGSTSNRYAANKEAIKGLKTLKIPRNSKDLSEWTTGDSLSYISFGEVHFHLGFGLTAITLKGKAAVGVKGMWGTEIKKTGKLQLKVAYISGKVFDASLGLQAIPADLKTGAEITLKKGFHYNFKLIDNTVEKYLDLFLRGKIAQVEEFVQEVRNAPKGHRLKVYEHAIIPEKKVESKSVDKNSKISFSIPFFISAKKQRGMAYTLSKEQLLDNSKAIIEHRSVFSQESQTRGIFSKNADRQNLFIGIYQEIQAFPGNNFVEYNRVAAEHHYSYERNKVDKKKFQEEFLKLQQIFGFTEKINYKIPEDYEKGSFKVAFDTLYSLQAIKNLMTMAKTSKKLNLGNFQKRVLKKESMLKKILPKKLKAKIFSDKAPIRSPSEYYETLVKIAIDNYFYNLDLEIVAPKEEDPKKTKKINEEHFDEWKHLCPNLFRANKIIGRLKSLKVTCRNTIIKESQKAMKKSLQSLSEMEDYYTNFEAKKFSQAFAEFGKHMLTNRFTFQTWAWEMRHLPVKIQVSVEGTNLTPWKSIFYPFKKLE